MIEGRNVLIAGFARTGQAVAEFLRTRDCHVSVSEAKPADAFAGLPETYPGVDFEFGGHSGAMFTKADVIILSPGIPDTIPPVVAAKNRGIPVLSEIELAYHYLRGTVIGITGTNGKSTTTELAGAMLKAGRKKAFVCGNIGEPLIEFCNASMPEHFYVVELSSFQLETIRDFRPHIAAILNLAEDHLDRYPSVEPYFRAKMRIFENQKENDFAVVNYDDPYLRAHMDSVLASKFWFSRKEKPPSGVEAGGDGIIRTISGGSVVNFSLGGLKGVHHLENTLCAASIALLCGVLPKAMQQAAEHFQGLRHRMELVAEKNGVRYYDDSKATNVDAVVKSLESFPGGILLIAGGKDKGCDYRVLRALVKERVTHLILIGEAAGRISTELGDVRKPEFSKTLEEAVQRAASQARPGDIVLLSPACSSFDMFKDYKERGDVFVRAVHAL
ncbi:MAG TPA: UDP-N-acetylmuramoyl-L-alanine--D-glutamate ligase [Acidobacteriota bacterium]|nr:UDP-N-acetylmuramoyl-L-alanine--D-glutamate ligase [Acidobacteriota bacterium]